MNAQKNIYLFPAALVIYEIITYLSNDMYLPSLPALMLDLNITQDVAQYTLLFWFLGAASMQLVMGPLSDRYGRKCIILAGGAFYILSNFICSYTNNVVLFLIARFVQGTTVCSVTVAGYAAIHELYDSKMAIKIIAVMGSVTLLAPAFGPLFGALILEFANWRWIFHFLAWGSILSVLGLMFMMPETNLNPVKMHLKEIAKDYFAIALRGRFLKYTLPFCLMFMGLICWIVESPFVVVQTYQKTPMYYGVLQLLVFGSFIIGAQVASLSVHRVQPNTLIKLGFWILLFAGIGLFSLYFLKDNLLIYLTAMMMVLGFGFAIAFGPLNRYAIESCDEPMGRRMAIFSTYMSIFGVLATISVTLFNDKSVENLAMLIAGSTFLGLIIYQFIAAKESNAT